MFLDLARAITFILSILMLYWVMLSAFFVPGTHWQERLAECALRIGLAACVCLASGLIFAWRPRTPSKIGPSPIATLPMRLFFWGMGAMAGLFVLSWYLEEYFIPAAQKTRF